MLAVWFYPAVCAGLASYLYLSRVGATLRLVFPRPNKFFLFWGEAEMFFLVQNITQCYVYKDNATDKA